MLSVVMLSVIMLSVIMLSVVAPQPQQLLRLSKNSDLLSLGIVYSKWDSLKPEVRVSQVGT